jgi:lipopolysaccharide transport system ATP-binding protein
MLPGRQGQAVLRFERLDLAAGAYFLDVGAYSVDWSVTYDYHWRVYQLHVGGHGESKGPLRPPYDWELSATTS